jgi:hypothetical protein
MSKCQKCDWNAIGANYCSACGQPIREICPVCGKEEKRISIQNGECEHIELLRDNFYDERSRAIKTNLLFLFLSLLFVFLSFIISPLPHEYAWILAGIFTIAAIVAGSFTEKAKKRIRDAWEIEKARLYAEADAKKPQKKQYLGGWGF